MTAEEILSILDQCSEDCSFPMLDNGYVYLAATRLSVFRSEVDWALVIEVFGYSPRAGLPDTAIHTFGSRLIKRKRKSDYVSREAFEDYLRYHPHDEWRNVCPIEQGKWLDLSDSEFVQSDVQTIRIRGVEYAVPSRELLTRYGITPEDPARVHVHELCRFFAATNRDQVLATTDERRVNLSPEMGQLLLLDEWNHPDLANGERPRDSETFQQLAKVLATGDLSEYRPSLPPNTHWINWPVGGTL
jgi:hypothetical protein